MNASLTLATLLFMSSAQMNAETKNINDTLKLGNINEVVVTGTRNSTDIRHLPMTISVVNSDKLRENERTNILPTLTEQVPGLFTTARGVMGYGVSGGAAGGMMMRGISSGTGQMLVLIDGHPQYNGVYGHSIADAYQTLMVERVEVLRGPASLLYGSNAMGGVVNIVTRGAKKDGMRTDFSFSGGSYGTLNAEFTNTYKKGRFSSIVAGQYSRTDNHRPNMGFEQYGGYAKLNYALSAHFNAFADIDLTHFNSSYPGTTSKPMLEADQWITRGAAALGIENNFGWTSGRLSVYDNFGLHKINDGYAAVGGTPQKELFRSKDALTGVSFYQSASLWKGNNITLGFDYQHIYGRAYYTNRETGEIVTSGSRGMQSGHAHNNEYGVYVDFRQDVAPWFTVDAGVRYDNHSISGGEWIPQGGFVFRPLNNGELKLMASKGFRNPTMKEMYLYKSASKELLPERMMNYEISWRQRLMQNRLSYGVNLFFIDADNIIQTINQHNVNTGSLMNKGIEVEADWHINGHWAVNTNHSYLHMKNKVVGAPSYKGYIGVNSMYGKWSVAAGVMQVSRLFTAVGANETHENFTLVNATIGYHMTDNMKFWVKGDNLLCKQYEINAGYPMPRATFMAGVNVSF